MNGVGETVGMHAKFIISYLLFTVLFLKGLGKVALVETYGSIVIIVISVAIISA